MIRSQQNVQQQASNPLIKMEPWAYGDHDDMIDDSDDEDLVAELKQLDDQEDMIEELIVRCGKGGYKKKGKKGKGWGRK